ncbi:TPA: hypothetical protein ACVH97_003258 [Yersinia enterocolitica]|uniref:hypothetical protein n=1 Tax=Yersinia enterocolitica TaxID=630 RepID=UPI001C8E15CB|nr:hypothetical protein [Yersinia enterocolitica]EKN3950432.1 hypothetical protein [Yersinia enterocolitica]EKN4139922.1 hypothetical protein [Yersinia enterocolitica]EKN4767251.1 hypothetical protein [Yersinia enterocolitica]EKN4800325.1 hypothetical protein [Yersinia enterocolitica]EKN4847257.1 hypothetical protein [Yersinia enterocolitica]
MSGHKITSSESVDNILLQSYHDPEKLSFFEKLIYFIRDILKLDVLDNHVNDIAQRLHDFNQYPSDSHGLPVLIKMVLELKNMTINELQKNYEIVQLCSMQKNERSGEYHIENEKIIFMYDGYEIAEYTNSTYLNENSSYVHDSLTNTNIPIRKGYTFCQYKEMENCFNDITMMFRNIREANNPEQEVNSLNLKTNFEKLESLSEINDFMRVNNFISQEEAGDSYSVRFANINVKLNEVVNNLNSDVVFTLLNELEDNIYSLKDKIVNDNRVKKTILNEESLINNIRYSEEGGKNRKIDGIKQTIDNIESLIQYCRNSLNIKRYSKTSLTDIVVLWPHSLRPQY